MVFRKTAYGMIKNVGAATSYVKQKQTIDIMKLFDSAPTIRIVQRAEKERKVTLTIRVVTDISQESWFRNYKKKLDRQQGWELG